MIAVIPARGGSKGLPGKNIKELVGKPLIQYTIEAALHSSCIDRVIVTTDDPHIIEVAKMAGAEVPFVRPDYLASDSASAVDVYIHAMDNICASENEKNKFMVLLPTAPLRTEFHIDKAYDLFLLSKADTVISVTEADTPPNWYMICSLDGKLQNAGFAADISPISNRQNFSRYYIPNGAIYILDYQLLKQRRTYYSDNTVPFIMSRKESIDIDTIDDFEYAEYILNKCGESR